VPYRVIQWYTGFIGTLQLKMMLADPRYDVVGAVVHHSEKSGIDIGELVGAQHLGIRTTDDVDAALALEADCVLVNGRAWEPDLMARILRSGKNVVNILGGYDLRSRWTPEGAELDEVARAAGVSLTGGGNMPGMLPDVIPLLMSGFTTDVTRIWTRERNCHQFYESAPVLTMMGYGADPDHLPDTGDGPDALVSERLFVQSAHLCADAFGLELSDFRMTNREIVLAPEDIHLEASGLTIKKGTVAGSRIEYTGFVDDEPWHVLEMEFTSRIGLGPGWRPDADEPEFTIRVDGDPPQEVTWACYGLPNLIRLNAVRMVNLVGPIIAARPGCRTVLDLPWVRASSARAPGHRPPLLSPLAGEPARATNWEPR
jgi:4-hydroxy-tetrahydrodipicolinate reductase